MPIAAKRHNVRLMLPSKQQQDAARLLFNILLLRRRLAGVSLTYFARQLGLSNSAMSSGFLGIAKRLDKEHGGYGLNPLPFSEIQRDTTKYLPTLDQLEIDACVALAHKRVEMLIRSTFMEGTRDIAIFRAPVKVKRKVGRPKGTTKDRSQAPESGWLMPDGSRFFG